MRCYYIGRHSKENITHPFFVDTFSWSQTLNWGAKNREQSFAGSCALSCAWVFTQSVPHPGSPSPSLAQLFLMFKTQFLINDLPLTQEHLLYVPRVPWAYSWPITVKLLFFIPQVVDWD